MLKKGWHKVKNSISINRLRTCAITTPLGIDENCLRFSWELAGKFRGLKQIAYQIFIMTHNDKKIVWDSGKVESNKSFDVEFNAEALTPCTRYDWKVKVWCNNDACDSKYSWFETGIKNNWKAKWIQPKQKSNNYDEVSVKDVKLDSAESVESNSVDLFGQRLEDRDYKEFNPCLYVRKEFGATKKTIKAARLYITAHGIYRAFINGKRVGNQEFAPEISSYNDVLYYQTYDVTDLISYGDNVLGVVLADGWWCGRVGLSGDSCQFSDMRALLLQLDITYEDGTKDSIVSDESLKATSDGPHIFADLFVGEYYDARKELDSWVEVGYNDSDWKTSDVIKYSYDSLLGQYENPVTTIRTFVPEKVIHTPAGETVLDLGQNIAGRIRINVSGRAGTIVSLECSEVLDENGNFLMNIVGRNKDQKDYYVLKGEGIETYEPWFTYHGFRYVRIEGYPGAVVPQNFSAVVISTQMDDIGAFICSNEKLNRLQQNIWWSQVANTVSTPTDCPQREKAGWTGDIFIYGKTASYLRDTEAFLSKWMHSMRADQLPTGEIPMVVPYIKAYLHIKDLCGSDSSCGWGDAVLEVPWVIYSVYGNTAVLRDNYETMKRWMKYVEKSAAENTPNPKETYSAEELERQKYLWNTGFHFADWLAPSLSIETGEAMEMFRSAFLTKELVAPAFFAYNTARFAQIAEAIGNNEDSEYYLELNKKIKRAFADEYIDGNGKLKAHYQGIYVLALYFGLYPAEKKAKGVRQLIKLIEENDYRLDTGFLSVPYLLDVLADTGHADVAYKLLYQTQCPSWLYEVDHGATTMWEAWQAIMPNGKVTNVSYNHYAFGCVGSWIYRYICGLKRKGIGYTEVTVEPHFDCGLTYAATHFHSNIGTYCIEWTHKENCTTIKLIVPPNGTAYVTLPGAVVSSTKESDIALSNNTVGISDVTQAGEDIKLTCDSGEYCFNY